MDNNETRKLAERIALLLENNERESSDFAFLRSSLEKINQRLDALENKFDSQNFNGIRHSAIGIQHSKHPSQEKFQIAEAVAPTETAEHFGMEKPCPYEPTGKLCDHCAMCNSRGF